MASAAEPVWRTGAVGHERPRLAGGPRGRDLADQHDRRCDQPMVCALCGERLDRGEHEPAGALRPETRTAVGVLHRQSVHLSGCGEDQTGRQPIGEEPGRVAADTDRPGIAGVGNPWIAAHSPQAKGRVERGFLTAQDRLVKGLRVAGVTTLEGANHYLETEFRTSGPPPPPRGGWSADS